MDLIVEGSQPAQGPIWSRSFLQPLAPGALTPFSASLVAATAPRAWYLYYDRLGFDPPRALPGAPARGAPLCGRDAVGRARSPTHGAGADAPARERAAAAAERLAETRPPRRAEAGARRQTDGRDAGRPGARAGRRDGARTRLAAAGRQPPLEPGRNPADHGRDRAGGFGHPAPLFRRAPPPGAEPLAAARFCCRRPMVPGWRRGRSLAARRRSRRRWRSASWRWRAWPRASRPLPGGCGAASGPTGKPPCRTVHSWPACASG